ncbi:hypothetical protein A3A84_02985 [Candidatus Collierbacteria bacterium RIFCSPLOWO2_01_FULL_50_23]|uniref:Uncharacterized protein n=1 Tax=Candidatus Collierbacteria bacterium RIFCSPHIGHO2_01_FULL_50_25 TaxID=1817722 RepID=A0A1F5EW78_9BACT|nr:MAG: hypothetical protein A2703_03860 [Candidatus Collierbacteria bacterium RIFCSPHIGHO2_01_FULL_50_25]OGD74424.1 MAG: hypothetical protein A3A84_02985 [Candidatus Collierbacteria bacterium RIFCSPLOWO2_01_FULL_50_23]
MDEVKMVERILRAGLGVIFFFVFFVFLLAGAVKFRVLSPAFWKTALDKGEVYQLLQNQVTKMRMDLEGSVRKQTGGAALPPEITKVLAPLLSLDKVLTTERFKELAETNVDRVFGYLNGKDKGLVLFLPVKEWNLPVAAFGQPALAKFTAQTPVESVFPILGMKPEQSKQIMEGLGQVKTVLGYLTVVWIILLLLTVGIGAGHYFLGVGQADRIKGTAWLLMISGFVAKLIGVGAGNIFEMIAANSKPPLEPWISELGRSLVGQFFNLGATIGLVAGIGGLVAIAAAMYFAKQGKMKEEKEKMGLIKRVSAFVLGVTLGFVVLGGTVAGLVLALGGNVNFSTGGGSLNVGSQAETGGGNTQSVTEEKQRLADDVYKSEKGWEIQFPAGWEVVKGETSEGVIKKPVSGVADWATIEVKMAVRLSEVDSGGYLNGMKYVLEAGKTNLKNAVFVEDPYEEKSEETGWRRFVFTFDYDDVVSDKTIRERVLKMEYYPPEKGDGILITARAPVESWGKYEKIIKESVDTFSMK